MIRYVLGLDTATEITVVALGVEEADGRIRVMAEEGIDAPRAAMSRLLPTIDRVLAENGVAVPDVSAVVVGRGPGSFTGVRIGVAAAKGLAQGLDAPLYGIGTLDAIAWELMGQVDGLVGVVGDAMRGEVYPVLFELDGEAARRLEPDSVAKPGDAAAAWAERVGDREVLLVGNGLRKHAQAFADALGDRAIIGDETLWRPTGFGMLAAFGATSVAERGTGDPGALLPVYTRLSDAEENERAKSAAASLPSSGVAGPLGHAEDDASEGMSGPEGATHAGQAAAEGGDAR